MSVSINECGDTKVNGEYIKQDNDTYIQKHGEHIIIKKNDRNYIRWCITKKDGLYDLYYSLMRKQNDNVIRCNYRWTATLDKHPLPIIKSIESRKRSSSSLYIDDSEYKIKRKSSSSSLYIDDSQFNKKRKLDPDVTSITAALSSISLANNTTINVIQYHHGGGLLQNEDINSSQNEDIDIDTNKSNQKSVQSTTTNNRKRKRENEDNDNQTESPSKRQKITKSKKINH